MLPSRGSRPSHHIARIVLLCVAWCIAHIALAQPSSDNAKIIERRVKAVSLYKFLGYVEWPPATFAQIDLPYVVGVINDDDLADELTRISTGHKLYNRAVIVKKMSFGAPLTNLNALFIGSGDPQRQAQTLKNVQSQPILVVTETEGALAQGSMINFRVVDDRVRFEVSLDTVEKAHLKISSRMLSVALLVARGTLE